MSLFLPLADQQKPFDAKPFGRCKWVDDEQEEVAFENDIYKDFSAAYGFELDQYCN